MDPLWLILSLVLVSCAEAENPTEVKVAPGENATLTCSNVTGDGVYWYIEIRSQVRGIIARAFGPGANEAGYCKPFTNQSKYMVKGNQMIVTNVTAEDHRLYFCAKIQNAAITVVETLRLLSDVPITPSTNDSNQQQQHNICTGGLSQLLVYGSFALNGVLLVITGLLSTLLCWKRKKSNDQVNEPSPLTYEDPQTLEMPQYEEIQLRSPPPASPPPECIYYKAQPPRSTASPHH